MVNERTTEIRLELPAGECSVMDGYSQATGKSRTQVLREILQRWSDAKKHEAILICRVAGINPVDTESNRQGQ